MHTPTALLFQDFRCSHQPEVNENYVSFLWYNNVHGQDMSMSMVDPREQGGGRERLEFRERTKIVRERPFRAAPPKMWQFLY